MTCLKSSFGIFLLTLLVCSCTKENSLEDGKFTNGLETQWEFKESGNLYSGNMDSAQFQDLNGFYALTFIGHNLEDADGGIVFQVVSTNPITTGSYINPNVYLEYSADGITFTHSPLQQEGFTISIISMDSVSVSGTFEGVVRNAEGALDTIYEGKFTVRLAGGSLPSEGEPEPFPEAQDYLPLYSVWTYGSVNDPDNDTLAIFSDGDTIIDDQSYTAFVNKANGDVKYYRKDNGVYYEYFLPGTESTLGPPGAEFIILKDDEPVDFSWESEPYTITYELTGTPITFTAKLMSTIVNRDYSDVINGVTYNNLIEVRTDLYLKNPVSGSYFYSDSSFETVFAKGIGIVHYEDVFRSESWDIRHFNVHD